MPDHALVMKTEKLSESKEIWKKIFRDTPNQSPFLSYEWFSSLSKILQKKDPMVFVFYSESMPVAILPAEGRNGKLMFVADERVTDMCDMLYLPGFEKKVVAELGTQVTTHGWHMDLFPLSDKSPLYRYVCVIADEAIAVDADLSPFLLLPDSWEEYLNGLAGKQRHEVRRKLRKSEQVELREATVEQIELLFGLMAVSSTEKKDFLGNEMRKFFIAVCRAFSKKGWLRYRIAFSEGFPIGAVLSFSQNGFVYLFNTGFDPEYALKSPGFITIVLDIKSSIEAGYRYYDFLRGGERFKFNLGAQERFMKRIRS